MSNKIYTAGYYFARNELFSDTSTRLFDPYKFRMYNAAFGAHDRVIVASNYSYSAAGNKNTAGIFCTQTLYFGNSYMMQRKPDPYFKRSDSGNLSDIPEYYSFRSVASDRLLFASVPFGESIINLSRSDGYTLVRLQGTFPCFSADNEFIYYLKDKSICRFPLKSERIFKLVLEKKIFGEPSRGNKAWKVI